MYKAAASRLVSIKNLCFVLVALLIGVGLLHLGTAYGAQLPTRSIQVSSASPGATATYKVGFDIPNPETLGSIRLQICAESPLIGQPCSLPTGMVISTATLTAQTPAAGFNILSISGTDIILTRPPAAIGAVTLTFTFGGIKNATSAGAYFGRLQTYATADATGSGTDYGGLAFSITQDVSVTATVPPYLYFCVGISVTGVNCATATGDYIDFGTFSPAVASVAQTQMVAGTNADTGYFIQVDGNTLTSGTNVIDNLVSPDVSRPGVSQFGINLVANSDPQVGQAPAGLGVGNPAAGYGTPNSYKFIPGDTVALTPLPDEARRYTTSYIANVAKNQAPGIYVTTLTYVATAGF
jgi:hypothetical protein